MTEIVLYGPAMAPFTQKVVCALRLKKLPYEHHEPQGPEDYARWSPETGLLPVLEIDGEKIADSTAILVALDERFPEPPLVSRDPKVAATQRRLEDWADETFFWYWTQWRRMVEKREAHEASLEPYRFSWAKPSTWFESLRPASGIDPEELERERFLVQELDHRMEDLVTMLGTRPFFYAEEPSMADLAVYAMLATGKRRDGFTALRDSLDRRPALLAFLRRVEEATSAEPPRV